MAISGIKRFVIGGLGGLAPVFALLVAVDLDKQLEGTTLLQVLGYSLRVLALFAIGGGVTWLHETENKPFKLFEIGLGAPALLAGLITTKSIIPEQQQQKVSMAQPISIASSFMPLPNANAVGTFTLVQDSASVKSFAVPKAEGSDAFWQGLLGTPPKNIYYVIVGSHLKYDDAQKQAVQINAKFKQFKAEVYAPYGVNVYYGVVIGADLTKSDASALRSRAIKAGLPKDTYLWTFPSLR